MHKSGSLAILRTAKISLRGEVVRNRHDRDVVDTGKASGPDMIAASKERSVITSRLRVLAAHHEDTIDLGRKCPAQGIVVIHVGLRLSDPRCVGDINYFYWFTPKALDKRVGRVKRLLLICRELRYLVGA